MRREAFKRLAGELSFRVFILLLILYTLYHCVVAANPRMTTAVITTGSEYTLTEGEAIIFRDETVLTTSGTNLLISYPVENGAKVSATSTLATVYSVSLDEQTRKKAQTTLSALDTQILAVERSERQSASSDTLAMLDEIRLDIRNTLLSCNAAATDGSTLGVIASQSTALLMSLNRYARLTGGETQTQTPLTALQAQRSALLAPLIQSSRTLTVTELLPPTVGDDGTIQSSSGYFYHADRVDGYETVFCRSDLATMNIADFDALLTVQPKEYSAGETVLGKMVSGYAWSIALPISLELSEGLVVGQDYSIRFPDEEDCTLSMTLDRIIRSVGDGRAVLMFSCEVMPIQFRYTRFQTVQLILEETEGYRVPKTALHIVGGMEGVYVLKDGCLHFRRVYAILRGEGYILAAIPPANAQEAQEAGFPDNYISLHDVVITSGENLYDGKYID